MTNILKCGINSNVLKTIALIAMVIDHIGFYFSPVLPQPIYLLFRYIGRIAMPIFVYLLVQVFFHTKNLKKYIGRLGIFAVITQIIIFILMFINMKFMPNYTAAKQVCEEVNILFAFTLGLLILKLMHEDILVKKWDYNKNLSLKIIVIIVLAIVGVILPIDYGAEVVVLSVLFYYIEKLKIQVYLDKTKTNLSVKGLLLKNISDEKIKLVYIFLLMLSMTILIIWFNTHWTILLSLIPISLYNSERGKTSLKYVYYITFVLQHSLLYLIAMLALT